MKILAILSLAIICGLFLVGISGPSTPPAPVETNGQRWARICAVEAGPSAQDQKDCVFRQSIQYLYNKQLQETERVRRQ